MPFWIPQYEISKMYCDKNMLTSHVNGLQETGHQVEAHGMWHKFLFNGGIGQIEQR